MTEEKSPAIRIAKSETVWKNFIHLQHIVVEQTTADGRTLRLDREVHDHGHAATILLVDPARQSVILVRQFRPGAYFGGHPGFLLETPAGLLDGESPEVAVAREAMEETGYAVGSVRHLFDAYASPGTLTERVSYFVGIVDAGNRAGEGGGLEGEGEEIEIVEVGIDAAYAMIASGEICDAKTIMLLQWLMLNRQGLPAAG